MLPCQKRLDAECFRHNPAWAKQALAYRLVHLLTPKQLTRRLPKGLRRALVALGVAMPPGLTLPDGTLVAPGTQLPATWTPGDPVPIGIIITPGTVFPSGWTPGDPVPEGVILEPGSEFPEGWTPPDPRPAGLMPAPEISPGLESTGPASPTFLDPNTPGPINQPGRSSPTGLTWWFWDPFDALEANDWSDLSLAPGAITPVNGTLKFYTEAANGHARYRRFETATWPSAFIVSTSFALLAHCAYVGVQIRWGTHEIQFYAKWDGSLILNHSAGAATYDVPGGHGTDQHIYSFVVTDSTCQILRDGVEVIAACQMVTTANPSQMYLTVSNDGDINDVRFEYFGVQS